MSTLNATSSLSDFAATVYRDGPAALAALDSLQTGRLVAALDTAAALDGEDDSPAETIGELAGEALELAASFLSGELEKIEETAREYFESTAYLDNFDDCMKAELLEPVTRERLAEILDESLTDDEFESLTDSIAAGGLDGKAGDGFGPWAAAWDIWNRKDALVSFGDGAEQAFPVDKALDSRLCELCDLFNKLDEFDMGPARDFADLFSSVCLVDGSKHGVDGWAILVQGPEQVLFYVDEEAAAAELAEYRKARADEQRQAVSDSFEREAVALYREDWPANWRQFLAGYRGALRWSTSDIVDGEDVESLEEFDFHESALVETRANCKAFIRKAGEALPAAALQAGYSWTQAGRDFWFSRAGHGVGFWERDELDAVADIRDYLDELAKEAGEQSPYIGRDGRGLSWIYL